MRRKKLIKLLEKNGWKLIRHGNKHDVFSNGEKTETIPRHTEISEGLANAIIRRNNLD